MAEVFTNNASTTIVGAVAATDTTLTIQTADKWEFPTVAGSDFFRVAMIKLSTGQMEIAKVTTHGAGSTTLDFGTTDNRGIEDTTALALVDSDILELRPTAGFFNSMATTASIQDAGTNYDEDTGAADVYVVTLDPVPTGLSGGFVVRFKASADNTGASTLNVNGLGAVAIKKNATEALVAEDILQNQVVTVVHDGTNFQVMNVNQSSLPDPVAANKVLGSIAGGSVEEIDCTAAGRALIDDANAAAQLVTLGLTATAAEINTLDGYTGSVTELEYLKTLYDTGVTNTEYDYLDGVTSNIQTQIDGIAAGGGTSPGYASYDNNASGPVLSAALSDMETTTLTLTNTGGAAIVVFGQVEVSASTAGYLQALVTDNSDNALGYTFNEYASGAGTINVSCFGMMTGATGATFTCKLRALYLTGACTFTKASLVAFEVVSS